MNALKRQVGPFPLYAWLAGGAVLIISIFVLSRMKPSGAGTGSAAGATGGAGVPPPYPYPNPNPPPPIPPAPPPTPPGPTQKTTATVSYPAGTWIYTNPHTTAQSIANVPVGTTLDVTGPSVAGDTVDGVGYWTPVKYGGITGYVSNARVQIISALVDSLNSVLTPTQQFAGSLGQTVSV